MRFQPSEYSPLGDAGGAGGSTSYVDVDDGGGTVWRVYEDGSTKAVSSTSYPSIVNQLKSPAESKQIISNLRATSPANASKIDNVIGAGVALPAPWSAAGAGGHTPAPASSLPETTETPDPFYKQVWFVPAVILGTTTVLSVGIWWWYTKHTGHTVKQQYAQVRAAMANSSVGSTPELGEVWVGEEMD